MSFQEIGKGLAAARVAAVHGVQAAEELAGGTGEDKKRVAVQLAEQALEALLPQAKPAIEFMIPLLVDFAVAELFPHPSSPPSP